MLAAVIVTFNRKTLLGENIRMLLRQTMPFDKIFIVDNCSTDGTPEYLKEQGWMDDPRFVYVKTHANIGGAGGFYTGTKTAFEAGADYIVLMDDDGRAADEYTFERLFRAAERLHAENPRLFVNSLVRQREWLSFKLAIYDVGLLFAIRLPLVYIGTPLLCIAWQEGVKALKQLKK